MNQKTELLAIDLIELFAAALRDLNEGQTLPASWRDFIACEVGIAKRPGRPPEDRVIARDLDIARRMRCHELDWEAKNTTKRITQFAEDLAEEYREKGRSFEAKDIFQIYQRYRLQVMSEEAYRRIKADQKAKEKARKELAEHTRKRLENGETLDEILLDPAISTADFIAIRNHQLYGSDIANLPDEPSATDYLLRQKAIAEWVRAGVNLHIVQQPVPIVNLRVAEDRALISTQRAPRRRS